MTHDPADRLVDCQFALEPAFQALFGAHAAGEVTGDESLFWPLRAAARKAGWSVQEIDAALAGLAVQVSGRPGPRHPA